MAQPPPDDLVGREAELAAGRDLLHALLRGAAAAIVIEGEAGIGKTELVRHLAAEAMAAGALVFRGEAHAFERTRPFGAISDALGLRPRSADPRRASIGRLLIGETGADSPSRLSPLVDVRFRVIDEIVELLETTCSEAPVVLALEDLHWADESTLAAVAAILHQLAHVPLLLVATLRPAPRSPELDVLLDDWVAASARFVRLRPLDRNAVDALVGRQLGGHAGVLLNSIIGKAGGNPLLLVELLRSLVAEGWLTRDAGVIEATADELPNTLRDLVLRRLRYLPARTLDLLQLASVLGEGVSIRDLAVVARRDATDVISALAEAFRGKLLDERDDAVIFRHQLVQQAIYEDLPTPVRKELHRDAAGALARRGADSSQIASHLLRSAERGDLEAVRWLRQAAVEAAGAPSVAVDLLRRTADLLPAGDDNADLVSAELAAALRRAGRVAEATRVAEAVLGRPHRVDVDAPLQLTLVDSLSLQNRGTELIARAEEALNSPTFRPVDRALVLAQASYGQTFSGDFVGAEATAARALELARQAGSDAMTAWSLCAGSVPVKTQGRYGEALSMARRAVTLAFEPVDHEARLRHPHFFLGMALADSDQLEEARQAYARAIGDAEELGSGWLLPDMLSHAAETRFLMGDWDDAWTELEAGVRLAEQHGQRISIPQGRAYQSLMAVARGDARTARALLTDLESTLSEDHPPYGTEMVALAVSTLLEADGDPARAFDVLLRIWSYDVEREVRYYHRYLAPPLVRLGLALGRIDAAEQVVVAVEDGAALAPEVPTVQSCARRCRGLLDHDPGALIEAVEHARRGRRILDHAGICEDAAAVLIAVDRPHDAKDLLIEAHDAYERVGAAAWAARVGAGLRGIGVRRGSRSARRPADHGWESLTVSERAVSELVAEGLTNRELARRLHISPHTVNTHLRHVFQKLSVTSRAELAATVVRSLNITHSSDVSPTAGSAS